MSLFIHRSPFERSVIIYPIMFSLGTKQVRRVNIPSDGYRLFSPNPKRICLFVRRCGPTSELPSSGTLYLRPENRDSGYNCDFAVTNGDWKVLQIETSGAVMALAKGAEGVAIEAFEKVYV